MTKPKISVDQSDWDDEIVKPITLKMKKGLWESFKQGVPRGTKLNDAVVDLIEEKVVEDSEEVSQEDFKQFMEEQPEYEIERRKIKHENS